MDEVTEADIANLKKLFSIIPNDVSKKLIINALNQVIAKKPSLPMKSCEKTKSAEYSILVVLLCATKNGVTSQEMRHYLELKGLSKYVTDELVTCYNLHKEDLEAELLFSMTIRKNMQVSDINWTLLSSSEGTVYEPGVLYYKIQLLGLTEESKSQQILVEFNCSGEKLQAFLSKLKQIERHCLKCLK